MSKNIIFSKSPIISDDQKFLKRKYIDKLLEEAIQKPVSTVIAGTGFGKTLAVYSFLQDSDAVTTWMQLTSFDNVCDRFWLNLANVISCHNVKLASDMEALGFPDTASKTNIFLSLLSDAGTPGKKYVTVFDDFYLLNEKKVLTLIENIVNAHLTDLCIMFISRNEPEINLTSLLVKGMVFAISEEDLRFSTNDIDRYFEMQNIHLSPQTMSKIYDNTNGWIFAIRLVELSIKQGAPHEEYAIEAMKLNIFKLIESKIFSVITRKIQMFLVKLSLFQTLPSELVKLLSMNNEQLINEVLKVNSFIRYDSYANIYCIHHLFLDFLIKKQDILTEDEKIECYHTAADWYVSNGYKIDAITYYGLAGDYEKIIDISLTLPHALSEEVAILLLDVFKAASEEVFDQQPLLLVLRARAFASLERVDEALSELAALKIKYEIPSQIQKHRSLLCEIYIVEAIISHMCAVFTNEFVFSDLFANAYKYMPKGSAILQGRHNSIGLGAYVCRVGSEKKEDMERYLEKIITSVPYASKAIHGYMYGLDDLAKAELAYFRNHMKSAERFSINALFKARKERQYEIENRALFYLLRIALSSGDYVKVKEIHKQLDMELEARSSDGRMWYDIVISWFHSMIGLGGLAAGWLKSNYAKSHMGLLVSGIENLSKIRYYLSIKEYDGLLTFIKNEENVFGIKCFLLGKIAIPIYEAVCLYHIGKQDEALYPLQEAYELSIPNAFTMQFIELGNDMVALTKFAQKSEECTIPYDWLQDIFRKSSTYAKRVSYVSLEYRKENQEETDLQFKLTRMELEFLTDLCHGMTIAEIALNRGISKNYLNNRLQIVYSKLGAQNVKDAIHIATLMKLIE